MSSINLLSSSIDVQGIVDNLMFLENAPVRRMQSKTKALQSRIDEFQTLNTKLSSLLNTANTLLYGSDSAPLTAPYSYFDRLSGSMFSKSNVTSSDENAIEVSSEGGAANGTYSISVSNLAVAQSMASGNFDDTVSALTGTGTLTIATGSNAPVDITIDSTNNTLSGVRDAINSAGAGVTATIINDGSASPYRLLITSNDSGTANAFTLTDSLSGGQALGVTELLAAEDAQFLVNGLSITKSSNTVHDVIEGITLNLKNETTGDVRIHAETDTETIVESLKELVTAYNEVSSFINSQFQYNAETEGSGVLAGDSTLRSIQMRLQAQVVRPIENLVTSYTVSSQVGLNFGRDGSLSLDEAKLNTALEENFTEVAALFLGDGTPVGEGVESSSILTNLQSMLDGVTDSLEGPIHFATDGLSRNIRSIEDRIGSYERLLESRRMILTAQFQKADEALRLLSVSQSSLSNQLGSLAST